MFLTVKRILLLGLLSCLGFHQGLEGQDVELLGKIHGTRPPPGYYDLKERDPGAFQFRRALFRRGLGIRDLPDVRVPGRSLPATYDRAFAQILEANSSRAPVAGTFNFPLILGLYSDSPDVEPEFQQGPVQAEFFDGPQANPNGIGTIPDFYAEISGGRVTLTGVTFDWQRTPLTQEEVAAGVSGLSDGSKVGEYIVRILESLDDGSVDWGQFDNDGPDGIPNSGDDDGFVDVLAVMHPTPGAECSGGDRPNRIWSHRWNLYWNARYQGSTWSPEVTQSILINNGYLTQTPSAAPNVDFIRILDYTIQPVRNCGGDGINNVGVFAHELGHGFGLPDLYVTSSSQDHDGIGNWGLMGTGSWGCDGRTAWSPCHMSPWSKEVLGWADIQTLDPGVDLGTISLPPVETSGVVFRINSGDGSQEYLLLENRQRLGFDEHLFEPGLLIWHIDPVTVDDPPGGINNDPDRMGVWLRQADGLNELGMQGGGRGNAGDPFPGTSGNPVFHAGSNPGSWTHDGNSMGVTLLDIEQTGQNMTFKALTRYQTLTLRVNGVSSGEGMIWVDGKPSPGPVWPLPSAPFQQHSIEAKPGAVLEEGIRTPFHGWLDGGPRVRDFTTQLEDFSLVANYEGREYLVDVTPTSPASGIVPGQIDFDGGDGAGWVREGETVVVTATPRTGFEFMEWAGGFYGSPNPASYTATGPVETDAVFGVIFSAESNPSSVTLQGGFPHTLTLTVDNGNPVVRWNLFAGGLPEIMTLNVTGAVQGTPLERGEFPMTLRAVDGIGLRAYLPLMLTVADPELPVDALSSAFLLTGPHLNANTRIYLDNEGNDNNAYDLGDFRAYVLRNPGVHSFQAPEAHVRITVPMGDMKSPPSGGGERKEDRP